MPDPIFVFFSYASEDQTLVDTIAESLDTAFKNSISTKNMSQFEPGILYRQEIDDALDRAAILLVVASGQEKLSHTFTGYEVGYFRKSLRTRPSITAHDPPIIDHDPRLKRLIIPMAILTDLPDTLSEIQGVEIPKSDQIFVHAGVPTAAEHAMYRLLIRFDQIISDLENRRRTTDESAKVNDNLKDTAKAFAAKLPVVLRRIPIDEDHPKTRLTISLQPDFDSSADMPHKGMMVTVVGPTKQIFPSPLSSSTISWPEFEKAIGGGDIALSWRDAVEFMVAVSIDKKEFPDLDQVLLSTDELQIFRLFVSSSTMFFDRSREVDIYVIPVLQLPDVGDPITTNLAKAISIALRYRSLFLEQLSPYTRSIFGFEYDTVKFKERARNLAKELRILFVRSRQARLADPHNIAELFGTDPDAVVEIGKMTCTWNKHKKALSAAVDTVITDKFTGDTRKKFLDTLEEFCSALEEMNKAYLTTAIGRLKQVIG